MDISTAHAAAVVAACRLPALQARLALLASTDATRATIALYGTARPAAGDPPGGDPVVTLTLTQAAGVVDADLFQLQIATPLEAQITGADPATGTIPLWARIVTPAGAWWADVSVSVDGGDGELQLEQTGIEGGQPVARLFQGAYCRLASFVMQG